MKAIKLYIAAVIVISFLSCNPGSNKFNMIQSKGLDAENLGLSTLLFCNKDTGFIAGSSDKITSNSDEHSDTFAFVKKTALLYKTVDGGNSWIAKDFGKGYFTKIIQVKNKIFAFKTSEDRLHFSVYSSNNFGTTWLEETLFPKGIYSLLSIAENFCAFGTDSNKRVTYFYTSDNEGRNWSNSYVLSHTPFDNPIANNAKMIYLSNSKQDTYFPNLIVESSIHDNTSKIMELPKNFDCYFLTNHDNQIKLCGKQDNRLAVYSLTNDKLQYEYSTPEKDSMNFPVGFYNNKNEDYIIVGRRRSGDVEHKILKTTENGKNWETINFERDNLISPFCFINDKDRVKAWFFAGSGKFQILQ